MDTGRSNLRKEGRVYLDSQVDGPMASGRLGGPWRLSRGSVGLFVYSQAKQEVEKGQEAG